MDGFGEAILGDSIAVPAAVTAIAIVFGGAVTRDRSLVVALAVSLGFIAGFDLIRDLAFGWPRAAADKLPIVAVLGVAGTLLAERGGRPHAARLVALAGPVLLIAARPLLAGQILGPLVLIGAGVLLWRALERPLPARRQLWLITTMALGLAGIAVFARTVLIGQLALAAGAVACAAMIRPPPSPAALLPLAALLSGITSTLALFSEAPATALVLIGLVPFAGDLSVRFARATPLREPGVFAALTLVPAALAIGWTRWTEGPPLYFG